MSSSRVFGRQWLVPFVLSVSACALSACKQDEETSFGVVERNVSHRLTHLKTCDDLTEAYLDAAEDLVVQSFSYDYGYPVDGSTGGMPPVAEPAPGAPTDESGAGQNDSPDYTGTNLQEEGVDEADIFKTNGKHIFALQGGVLRVLKSWPIEDTTVIARVDVPHADQQEMYLLGDHLVIVSHSWAWNYYDYPREECTLWAVNCNADSGGGSAGAPMPMPDMGIPEYPYPSDGFRGTRVIVFDISDPTAPTEARRWELSGNLVTSRAVDGTVYLVQQGNAASMYSAVSYVGAELDLQKRLGRSQGEERLHRLNALRPDIRRALRSKLNADALPSALFPTVRLNDGETQSALACNDVYRPDAMSNAVASLSVLAIDPTQDALPNGTAILSDGWTVYGSTHAVYIARSSQSWAWTYNNNPESTDIHQFELGDGEPLYVASGNVEGTVNGRFAMSERDGYFRVATTDGFRGGWGGGVVGVSPDIAVSPPAGDDAVTVGSDGASDSSPKRTPVPPPAPQANNLYVLQRQGDILTYVGSVHGYGVNERIYGVRYVDDMAYVVTFRQTDPLYAIDLSEPADPRIRGELKIPGFSNFLQSVGDGWLIGVGNDANENGAVTGFQMSLFDVRNADAPTRTSTFTIPFGNQYASSEAAYESRAFTWYASQQLLAIPLSLYSYTHNAGEDTNFQGAVVFHVTPEAGIQEVGRVNHNSMAREAFCGAISCEGGYYDTQVRRTAFISTYFIAMSGVGITVSPISAIEAPLLTIPFY